MNIKESIKMDRMYEFREDISYYLSYLKCGKC